MTDSHLTNDEREVIRMMRAGIYERITILQRDGKIERIEAAQTLPNDTPIADVLSRAPYQAIEIQQAEGRIVNVKRIEKRKP